MGAHRQGEIGGRRLSAARRRGSHASNENGDGRSQRQDAAVHTARVMRAEPPPHRSQPALGPSGTIRGSWFAHWAIVIWLVPLLVITLRSWADAGSMITLIQV
jgi:hypothetical protein